MSSVSILGATAAIILCYVASPDLVNRIFDLIVPGYTLVSILAIGLFIRKQREASNLPKKSRVYAVPRKPKAGVELSWKQKFIGTWDKHEREGFVEVIVTI